MHPHIRSLNVRLTGFLCLGLFSSPLVSPADPPPQKQSSATSQPELNPIERLDAWAQSREPNENHRRLDVLEGEWDLTMKMFDNNDVSETQGSAKYHWIFEKKFLVEEVQCTLAGEPFEWMGIYGYDNLAKVYTAVWVDNIDTSTETAEGRAEAGGKAIRFAGQHKMPGGQIEKFDWVIKRESKDRIVVEMYQPDDGNTGTPANANRAAPNAPATKVLEIVYRRKGAPAAAR